MSLCDGELADILSIVETRYRWTCRPLPDGRRVIITTNRVRADSEPVKLHASLADDVLTVSDGGQTLNLLADASFDPNDPVLSPVWREALSTYRLQEADGRVFVQTPLAYAPHALNRFADALVALGALQVIGIPPAGRARTLADEVEDYLASLYDSRQVQRKPQIRLSEGINIIPALRVETPARGGVLVQTGAATSVTQSYDHAYALMSLARRGGVSAQNCLVVLGGSVNTWNYHRLRALSDISFVGFWEDREQVHSFLDGETPDDTLMVPPGFDVPLITSVD